MEQSSIVKKLERNFEVGTPLRLLIAETTPQTLVARVCRIEVKDALQGKGHRAFI